MRQFFVHDIAMAKLAIGSNPNRVNVAIIAQDKRGGFRARYLNDANGIQCVDAHWLPHGLFFNFFHPKLCNSK
jgi:hypothetical protein